MFSIKSSPLDRRGLDSILSPGEYAPQKLVEYFAKVFPEEYASDVGVWEGYSLGQHTVMVLNQFEKYFSNKQLPGDFDKDFLRVVLALHDLGKPKAVREGNKHLQHKYTSDFALPVLKALGFPRKWLKVASALYAGDAIGSYIKHDTLEQSHGEITKLASDSGLGLKEFFELLVIYYKVDAGSYTKDAGGKKSLDFLFDFNLRTKEINFNPSITAKVEQLETILFSE